MEFRKLISNILKLCLQTLNSSLKITVVLGSLLDYFLEYCGKHKNIFVFHICFGLLLWLHRTIICVGREFIWSLTVFAQPDKIVLLVFSVITINYFSESAWPSILSFVVGQPHVIPKHITFG